MLPEDQIVSHRLEVAAIALYRASSWFMVPDYSNHRGIVWRREKKWWTGSHTNEISGEIPWR